MIKLDKIQPNNLSLPETTKEIKESVQECIDFVLVSDATDLLKTLETAIKEVPELEQNNPPLFEKYNDYIFLLKWLGISQLSSEEVGELVKEYLFLAIKYGVDVEKRISSYLILYNDFETGGKLRWKFIELIRENEEKFSDEGLKYIKDWIMNYEGTFDIKKRRGTLEQMGYMNKNENVRKLGQEQRELLLILIKFYDFLRFKPLKEIFTVQEKTKTVKLPAQEEKENSQKVEEIKKEATQKYQESVKVEDINKKEIDLAAQYSDDFNKLIEDLINEFNKQDINNDFVFGALLYLIEKNNFTLLVKHAKLREEFLVNLRKARGKNIAASYELNDLAPSSIKLFLQFILRYKLNMTESDSAAFGVKLVNAFKKVGKSEYQKIVYFDMESKNFLWDK